MKSFTFAAELDPATVYAGTAAMLRVTFTNTSSAETMLVLEAAAPRDRLARPDWSRIAGPLEPRAMAPDVPRILFPVTTFDALGRNVDATPTLPVSPAPAPIPPKLLGIRVRPGGKLTHTAQWWALRIPAPAPIVTDDAGHHRYVPKTAPTGMWAGDYYVVVELPLHGLAPVERLVTTRVHVERPPPKEN
jgi:hypothetical protein